MSKIIALVLNNQGELTRFLKFAVVGAIGSAIDFGVLNLLVLLFGWPKGNANLVSVSCAIVSNFLWNRYWTFPESRERSFHTQLGQYALVNLIGLAINQVVFLTTDTLWFEPTFGTLGYNLAKATAILIVLFWNFFVNRRWTYKNI